MTKTNKLAAFMLAAMAVLMVLTCAFGVSVSAEEAAPAAQENAAVQEENADAVQAETDAAPAAEEPAQKSNPLLSGIILVGAVGAVALCIMEIRKDNKRRD